MKNYNEPKNSTKCANTKITKNAANIKNTIKVTENIPGAYRSKYQVYLARRRRAGESLGLSHRQGNRASEASRSVTSDCHPKRELDDLSSLYPSLPTV